MGSYTIRFTGSGHVASEPLSYTNAFSSFSGLLAPNITFDFSTYSQRGGVDGPPSIDASTSQSGYTLVLDGYSYSTYIGPGRGYFGSDFFLETKATLSLSNGSVFNATGLYIYNYTSDGRTITLSSDNEDSFNWGYLGSGFSADKGFNFTGITKLYITADSPFAFIIDNFDIEIVPTSATSTASSFDTTSGINLTPSFSFGTNDETLTIASASHTSGSTINGGGGNDELVLSDNGTNLAQATSVSGFETLSLNTDVSASMTEAQHDAFTIINGTGTNQITITDTTDGLIADADIETYVLSTANTITVGADSQNITGSSGDDIFISGARSISGTLNGNGGTDTLRISGNPNLSAATITSIETLEMTDGAVATMTEAQHDAFTTITGTGTNQITISNAVDGITGNASIETYELGAANSFTLGTAGQNVTGSSGDDTINVGTLTATGTLNGNTGTDTLALGDGASITGATVSSFENLSLATNASVSAAASQLAQFTGTVTASGSETMTVSGDGNFTTLANIEQVDVGDDSTNTRTITLGTMSTSVTATSATDAVTFNLHGLNYTGTLTGEGTTNDTVELANGAIITGATLSNIENLTLASNAVASMTVAQLGQFSGTIAASGNERLLLSGDGDFSTKAEIENYTVYATSTNTRTITVTQAGANIYAQATGDSVTFDVNTLALTGIIVGDVDVNDTLKADDGANLAGATIVGIEDLSLTSSANVILTSDQLNAFTGTITAAGSETLTLTTTGTLTGANLDSIETLATQSNASGETITLSAATANGKELIAGDSGSDRFIITASAGDQTLTGSAGSDTIDGGAGADVIAGGAGTDSLTGGADNDEFKGSASDLNGDTITDLSAGDSISITGVTGLSTANVRFNGNSFEIDTDATTFANPEVSINLGSDLSSVLQIASVSDSGSDTLITFASFNNQPVFSALNGTPVFTENGSAVVLDNDVTVADTELDALNAGNGNYDGASLTIARNGGASNEDTFGLSGGTLVESGDLTVSSTIIGTVTTNSAGTLVLSFNSAATSALVDQALQNITYANTSEAPSASVVLDWTFNDGAATSAGTNQTTVSITATNDAPVLDASQNPVLNGITEDAGNDNGSGADGDNDASANTDNPGTAVAALVVDNSITDVDGAAVEAIAVTAVDNTNGVWQYSTDNGSNWVNFSATTGQVVDLAANSRLLDGSLNGASTHTVRFVPDTNYNGSTTLTFRAWDKTAGAAGATANTSINGGTTAFSSLTDTASVTVSSVNDAPTAADTTESMSYNASYTFTVDDFGFSDVDTGDTLDHITIKTLPLNGTLILDGTPVTVSDTQVTLAELNSGKLVFTPASGGTGNDYANFTFTVSDGTDDSVTANTVTLNVGAKPVTPTPTPEPEPEPAPDLIDGATVDESNTTENGQQVAKVTISPITSDREDTDSNTSLADIPLHFDENDEPVTTLSLPVGIGATARSNETATDQTSFRDGLYLLRDSAPASDWFSMINGMDQWLNGIGAGWLNQVTFTSNSNEAPSEPIKVSGVEGDKTEVMVIDASQLPAGTIIDLDNIEFAIIVGDVAVRGGSGSNVVFAGSGNQNIVLGEDDDELHGGDGDDTVGSEGGDDLLFGENGNDTLFGGTGKDQLHGGMDNDIATYEGNFADYLVEQSHGVVTVTRLDDDTDVDTLINIEQIQFADQNWNPVYSTDLSIIATLYQQVLDRQADLGGFQYWSDIADSRSKGQIALEFLTSDEYQQDNSFAFEQLSLAEQIEQLYQGLLGRSSDLGGKEYWSEQLAEGMDLSQVAEGFVYSDELNGQLKASNSWDFFL